MFNRIKFSMNRVFPTLVVSTMSSGKSTLINALVGTDLLPSMNRACTAKAVAILDNDWKDEFVVHAVDKDGKYSIINEATKELIEKYNQANDADEILIEGEIQGIKNSKKSLLLIDTPGINNAMDQSHESVTKSVLSEFKEGLILYVINAQQIGTNDDSDFLFTVASIIDKNPEFDIVFALNKMDSIDKSKEEPYDVVENCRKYIESKGISEPRIIPISAQAALLFKKVLNDDRLSEFEEESFGAAYRRFRREGFSLQDFAQTANKNKQRDLVTVDDETYTRAQVFAALENTGVPLLEREIDELLVRSLKMKPPRITATKTTSSKSSGKMRARKSVVNKRTNRRKTK